MWSPSLVVCLALVGLAGANPAAPRQDVSCSDQVQPLKQLNISQLHGDWLLLTVTRYIDGVRTVDPRTPEQLEHFSRGRDHCLYFRIEANSTESSISSRMGSHVNASTEVSYEVSAEEKGRWIDRKARDDLNLVISADPGRHMVLYTCMTRTKGDDVTRTLMVSVFTRYDEGVTGQSVLTEADLENLQLRTNEELALPTNLKSIRMAPGHCMGSLQ